MRFACQSCGKAYNLPEERIAEKSNVKLKCRVCGAIVEVKKQGDVVAQILSDIDGRRGGRVSEAPAPLASMSPDDPEDATAAIAVSDGVFPVEFLPPLPPPPATGFAMAPLPPPPVPPARAELAQAMPSSESPIAPPLPPVGASPSPPPPPFAHDVAADVAMRAGSVGTHGSNGSLAGTNGAGAHLTFGHVPPVPAGEAVHALDDAHSGLASVAALSPSNVAALSNAAASPHLGVGAAAVTPTSVGAEPPSAHAESDTNKKMIAAFFTGIVVDRIISGLLGL